MTVAIHTAALDELRDTRYALLRTFRSDGTPTDTPIWFGLDHNTLLFRTKVGPKTQRLAAQPAVELTACDYRGRVRRDASTVTGHAAIVTGPRGKGRSSGTV